jgi:hypothetical protein
MSPTVKKILIGGGVVVGAYVVYSMIKKSAPAKVYPTMSPAAASAAPKIGRVSGIEEELEMSNDLGSLGGAYR